MSKQMDIPPPPPQWVIDLNSPPVTKPKTAGIPDPPGFTAAATGSKVGLLPCQLYTQPVSDTLQKQIAAAKQTVRKPPTTEETDTLKLKKAWEIAIAPIKQLPMTGIMMYMSGNGLQIFSIMMVVMAFKNPIMGLLATNSAFTRFESEGNKTAMLGVKATYVAMQLVALALGVWKVNQMGLLP
jgi:hypothetical protein